jgi:hypothetical protein
MFINSGKQQVLSSVQFMADVPLGEFYAHDLKTGNLEMISRFFERYPDYADRAFLSVKVNHNAGSSMACLPLPGRTQRRDTGIRLFVSICMRINSFIRLTYL